MVIFVFIFHLSWLQTSYKDKLVMLIIGETGQNDARKKLAFNVCSWLLQILSLLVPT